MLDINLFREQPDLVRKSLTDRQLETTPVDDILELDKQRRNLIQEVEALKAERNIVSKEIAQIKDEGARQAKIDSMREVGDRISELSASRCYMNLHGSSPIFIARIKSRI